MLFTNKWLRPSILFNNVLKTMLIIKIYFAFSMILISKYSYICNIYEYYFPKTNQFLLLYLDADTQYDF